MKQKILAVVCVIALMLSLCACGEMQMLLPEFLSGGRKIRWEAVPTEASQLGSRYKNYFDTLDDDQKKGYNNILETLLTAEESFPERIEVPMMTGGALTAVLEALGNDNPELMMFGKNSSILTEDGRCYLKPTYIMTVPDCRQKLDWMAARAADILSTIQTNGDEFRTELMIHDAIVSDCKYQMESDTCSLAYSCLIEHAAACEGYSKAAKYLLEQAGIECYTVAGEATNDTGAVEGHMWNVVGINGAYYYLDVTWDDPDEAGNSPSHLYFNLTQEEIERDHSDFEPMFPCTETADNYFVRTGSLFSSYGEETLEQLARLLGDAAADGKREIEFRFDSDAAFRKAIRALADEGEAYTLAKTVNRRYGVGLPDDNISYSKDDRFCAVSLLFR